MMTMTGYRTETRWLLPAFIVLGILCLLFIGGKPGVPAQAEAKIPTVGNGRVLAVPVQLERDTYGLAMIDTHNQTLWVYELNSRGPVHNRLKLLAARSWVYDKLIRQYNTAEPKPEQVKLLLEDLGSLQKAPNSSTNTNASETSEPNGAQPGGL
jgi:hypothetical protein